MITSLLNLHAPLHLHLVLAFPRRNLFIPALIFVVLLIMYCVFVVKLPNNLLLDLYSLLVEGVPGLRFAIKFYH